MFKRLLLNLCSTIDKIAKWYQKEHFSLQIDQGKNTSFKLGKGTTWIIHPKRTSFSIGKDTDFRNNINFVVGKSASLVIEQGVFMNNNCSINCLEAITIGEGTLFGEGVRIYDHNHKYQRKEKLIVDHKLFTTSPVKIGANCWLGSNVIVLQGVTIGANTIIGAGCVIHKDIPENSIIINKQEFIIKN